MEKTKFFEWIRCNRKYMLCVAAGIGSYFLAEIMGNGTDFVENGVLYRNPCGQGEAFYEISVEGLGEPFSVELSVPEQELSEEAFRALVPEMAEELLEQIVGENPSLQEVYTNLQLVRELPEYGVTVSWQSDHPEIVANDGTVYIEASTDILLEAKLNSGDHFEVLEIPITVVPPIVSREERFRTVLEAVVLQSKEQEEVMLPYEFEGKTVRYRNLEKNSNEVLLLLGIVAAVCLFLKERDDTAAAQKKREEQLMEDYPDFVCEFLILVGAGYSVKAAWKKMAESYVDDERKKKRPLCKEMLFAVNQMETGVPEVRAYTEFGRRCGNRNYVKFSSLLESSINTGGKNLRRLLETEVKEAFEMRTDIAKRKGEEASAKLLFPTFVMLGVVMVMVMAPAFMTVM